MLCQHWLGSPDMSRGLRRGRSGWISSQSGSPKHEQTIQERLLLLPLLAIHQQNARESLPHSSRKRVNKTDRILTSLSVVCFLRDISPDPGTGQGAVTHLRLGFGISQLRGTATEDAVFSSECLVSLAEVLLLENQARWERL